MAQKPLRPCRRPGCGELTREGWCPAHKPERGPDRCTGDGESFGLLGGPSLGLRPNNRPGGLRPPWRRWYSLKLWTDDLRPAQLLREPFCRECAQCGIRTPASDVDHIRDHKGDWNLFTDRENLQSLCHACHSRKTLTEMNKKRRDF